MADLTTRVTVVPALCPGEFDKIRRLAFDKFGLDLKPGKEELVLSRLGRRLRDGGYRSFSEYYEHVVNDQTGESLIALIDSLATNYTSFFREAGHFEFLQSRVLPALRHRPEISMWCAAAATGEEPYSLVFTLLESLGMKNAKRIRILATDISMRALEIAERGIYPTQRFERVPCALRQRYLLRGHGTAEGFCRIRPELRQRIEFRRLNLIEPFTQPDRFPVIFCRNVMIYFNQETKRDVVARLLELLEPGGYLFVGHAESLGARDFPLDYVQPAVYRKRCPGKRRPGRKGFG
jgi:chemotaxis protein methyltransferase CheR